MNRRTFIASLVVAPSMKELIQNIPKTGTVNRTFADDIALDLSHIPYSIAGSYLTLGVSEEKLVVKTVRRSAVSYRWQQGAWSDLLLEVGMLGDGSEIQYEIFATTTSVMLKSGNKSIELLFSDTDTLLVASQGCGVQIIAAHTLGWIDGRRKNLFRAYDPQAKTYFRFQCDDLQFIPGSGANTTAARDRILTEPGSRIIAIDFSTSEKYGAFSIPDFAQSKTERRASFNRWLRDCPQVDNKYQSAADTGWYLFSALQVQREGLLKRQTVLSSKMSMDQIWSWDNCINALALAQAQPTLAWDQLFTILDHQKPNGVLPDVLSDSEITFGFNKPPIWAWTVQRLLSSTPTMMSRQLVEEIYPKITRFHEWWFRERDLLDDGLPCYMNGNDSGWDNSTVFASRWPVQSPDLIAWLILDSDGLADMAKHLGKSEDEARFRARSTELLRKFRQRFWIDGQLHFFEITPDGPVRHESTSLLTSIPLLLGQRLDADIRKNLIAGLTNPSGFFAPSGPSSEALSSPYYEANGYWRGPVWGISTFLICSGLVECGELALARTLATRFCDTCARDGSFRENYNALTGAGQYDSGMTWAAADFLLLARWLHRTVSTDTKIV